MQLSALTNNQFFIGHASMLVNEGLPQFVIKQMKQQYPLRDMTVGVLGMAFKANIDDLRDSLSLKLRDLLEVEAKETICSDPIVTGAGFVGADEAIRRSISSSLRLRTISTRRFSCRESRFSTFGTCFHPNVRPLGNALKVLLTGSSASLRATW